MKFWQILQMGGIAVYVLLIFSVLSIAVIIEKIVYFRKKSRISREKFMKKIKDEMEQDNLAHALNICEHTDTPFAKVVFDALAAYSQSEKSIVNAMERRIAIET